MENFKQQTSLKILQRDLVNSEQRPT